RHVPHQRPLRRTGPQVDNPYRDPRHHDDQHRSGHSDPRPARPARPGGRAVGAGVVSAAGPAALPSHHNSDVIRTEPPPGYPECVVAPRARAEPAGFPLSEGLCRSTWVVTGRPSRPNAAPAARGARIDRPVPTAVVSAGAPCYACADRCQSCQALATMPSILNFSAHIHTFTLLTITSETGITGRNRSLPQDTRVTPIGYLLPSHLGAQNSGAQAIPSADHACP